MGWEPKWKHRPCPCGCGEMADECMSGMGSPLAAFQIVEPVTRPDKLLVHDRDFEANVETIDAVRKMFKRRDRRGEQ